MATPKKGKKLARKPAETEREWWMMLHSDDRTFIRSIEDWKKALKSKNNPLAGIDEATVKAFTKNLRFSNGALGHANYDVVQDELSYRRFSALWGRFGLGMGLFEDYKDRDCSKRATCSSSITEICLSSC